MALSLPRPLRRIEAQPQWALIAATTRRREAHGERRWLLGVAAVALALSAAPYVVAALAAPPDLERVGTFWFARDFSQYQAAMREGAESTSWLIHDRFTAEPHAQVLMYPLYVGLGKLAALLGISDLVAFGAAEWAGRVALVGAIYAFARTFLAEDRGARRLAVLLSVGTLGLAGWILPLHLALRLVGGEGFVDALPLPRSINSYLEISSFGVFLSAPHLMLGLALTLACAPLYLRAAERGGHWLAALGAAALGLSVVHPFNLPVLASGLAIDAIRRSVRDRPRLAPSADASRLAWTSRLRLRLDRPALVAAAVVGAAVAPMVLYNAFLFQADPFWSGTYGRQNVMPSPAPWWLPVDFGVVLLAAPLAWSAVRAWPTNRRGLLLVWIGAAFLWMYAPVPYQRRFAFGLQPALAVLAAAGLVSLSGWMRARGWGAVQRRLATYAIALAATMTSVLVYLSLLVSAASNAPLEVYVWTRAEADAARWLARHSDSSDVVMADTLFANPLVGVFDGRVVHGHIVATRDSARKEALVRRFYASGASPAERSAILGESGATIVALGPRERALGAGDLASQPELTPIYNRAGVEWLRVRQGSP